MAVCGDGSPVLRRGGGSVEDAAAVAVKNRARGVQPRAQFSEPVTIEQVLTSRMIADPLRLLMCSPVADGAAAVVVCSEERARSFGAVPPVRIDASILRSGVRVTSRSTARSGASTACEAAG